FESAKRLNPISLNTSIDAGGLREFPWRGAPAPGWPFSATVASKLVNTTSPLSSGAIADTADGADRRTSPRSLDRPVRTTVSGADWDSTTAARPPRDRHSTPTIRYRRRIVPLLLHADSDFGAVALHLHRRAKWS